ncbi:hypothetical protein Vadar_022393 [Vaccinium darrowii]|uniref:Uncharacterized protein n=1 Tax=Vaccinium darrowii TaxID=229202 RepID=A0ACB7XBY3_9ERIC|nr:hypothetical protein Vadar_022393 [Vaccinium darrowii]
MNVHMDCPGCESKIKKALQKMDGVDDIDIDMAMQKVTVTGWVDPEESSESGKENGKKGRILAIPPAAVSSYNYYVHGYTGHDHGYFNEPPHSTILDDKARSMFSDDNANACSIM